MTLLLIASSHACWMRSALLRYKLLEFFSSLLAQKLGNMVKKASGDFTSFRVQKVDAGDGITEYWVLLREEELKKELKGHL